MHRRVTARRLLPAAATEPRRALAGTASSSSDETGTKPALARECRKLCVAAAALGMRKKMYSTFFWYTRWCNGYPRTPLALHVMGSNLPTELFVKRHQLLSRAPITAWVGAIRRESTREESARMNPYRDNNVRHVPW